MKAQIIVSERVDFDKEIKKHVIRNVVNDVSVPALPYAVSFHIYVKLYEVPASEPFEVHLEVAIDEETIGVSNVSVLRNYRKEDQIPGVDTSIGMGVVLIASGNYSFKLLCSDTGEVLAEYPVTVRLDESRLPAEAL